MYTERDWERLFNRLLESGLPVSSFCELLSTPSRKTMWKALAAHPDVLGAYREAFPAVIRRRASRLGGSEETGQVKVHDLPRVRQARQEQHQRELERAIARAEEAEARSKRLAEELEELRSLKEAGQVSQDLPRARQARREQHQRELERAIACAEEVEARSRRLAEELEVLRSRMARPNDDPINDDPIVLEVLWVSDPEARLGHADQRDGASGPVGLPAFDEGQVLVRQPEDAVDLDGDAPEPDTVVPSFETAARSYI